MREERRQSVRNRIRLEVKRSTELWLYSFADMYMIIAVLFIATTALYAKKAKEVMNLSKKDVQVEAVSSALRGPAAAALSVAIEFETGSTDLSEQAIEQLNTILPLVSEVKTGVIDIEGYADRKDLAADSDFDSNLELSSQRAITVAEWFVGKGIGESRVRATAFGRGHKLSTVSGGEVSARRVVVKFYSAGT